MTSYSYALDACESWALANCALIGGDQNAADLHRSDADIHAYLSGMEAFIERREITPVLVGVPALEKAWQAGYSETEGRYNEPCAVWTGDWSSDMDGLRETRPSVSKVEGGYCPGLEVSYQGGDCEPCYRAPLPTLKLAIDAAKEWEAEWHAERA
ncbi:TPA: hypothetical protein ACUNF5_007295 [Burkholderia orbicola]